MGRSGLRWYGPAAFLPLARLTEVAIVGVATKVMPQVQRTARPTASFSTLTAAAQAGQVTFIRVSCKSSGADRSRPGRGVPRADSSFLIDYAPVRAIETASRPAA